MKPYALIVSLLAAGVVHADPPPAATDQLDKAFIWKGVAPDLIRQAPETTPADNFAGQPDKLSIARDSSFGALTPATYTLRTLGPSIVSQISSQHYAITGHIRYRDINAGSFLELQSWFAPEQSGGPEAFYFSRTLADEGPMAKIEGSDGGRDFALPFDATGAKTPLERLVLRLHLTAGGMIEFTNVRLVQYPDTPTAHADSPVKAPEIILTLLQGTDGVVSMDGTEYPSEESFDAALKPLLHENPSTRFVIRGSQRVPYIKVKRLLDCLFQAGAKKINFATTSALPANDSASLTTMAPPSSEFNFRSFWFGVLAALAAVIGASALFFLALRFRGLRHARELRRIASLDG